MTLTVNAKSSPVITEVSSFESSCYDQYELLIDVPSGTRHVEIIATGIGASPDVNQTISVDTTYIVYLGGAESSNNITRSSVVVIVRDTNSSGTILETKIYNRLHSGQFC